MSAGIVRPDWSFEDFSAYWFVVVEEHKEYYLSNKFLEKWLVKGYIPFTDVGHSNDCVDGSACDACDDRWFLNMSCAIVDDSYCFLEDCYLPYAKFDNTEFYKATINNCVLDGVTAYNTYFMKCNGYMDDLYFVKYLEKAWS